MVFYAAKDNEKIKNLLARNVVEIIDKENLEKRLKRGEKLRIKLGIDPTGPKIHLGRAIALRKLKEFQELGHQVVLIIGDFTGLVGDASDKTSARPMLTEEQLKKNMADYRKQIGKILDVKKTEFRQNSEWLAKLNMKEIIHLASLFTVHQMIDRRNFKERFDAGQTIGLHEFLYPLLQGYDSAAIKADVELGGTDQLFNLKAGRKIQEFYGQPPQDIMTLEMLPGLDGEKMSTSRGNIINIADDPNEMYGKIMSMKDELIPEYFLRCTDLPEEAIKEKVAADFFQAKNNLAFEIVKMHHGENAAVKAGEYFRKTFREKKIPDEVPEIRLSGREELIDFLIKAGAVDSRSSFRRLIKEGAVEINQKILKNIHYLIKDQDVIRIGKKKFLKAVIKPH
jgi:tyrosyl-tRNA synthetase